MSNISFYYQQRADGGLRSGISISGNRVMEHFEGSHADYDPSLLWFVDVRCHGELPEDPEEGRRWLLSNRERISDGLNRLAEKLRAGIDIDSWPVVEKLDSDSLGNSISIACSAIRREDALEIAKLLSSVATNWENLLSKLSLPQAAG